MTKAQRIESVLARQTAGEICAFGRVEVKVIRSGIGLLNYHVRVPGFHRDFTMVSADGAAKRIAGLREAQDFFRQFPNV